MAAIKPLDVISRKYATVTPQRAPQYAEGVKAPRADWAEQTVAAHDRFAAGMQAAIASKSQQKGVQAAGTAKWQRGALGKGVDRYGPGVQAAEGDYSRAFAPYRQAIEAVNLPQRFARRDPRNLERVRVIDAALIEARKRIVGG